MPAVTSVKMFLCRQTGWSKGESALPVLVIKLLLKFILDDIPALAGVWDDAAGTVLQACGQDAEITRAGEEKERAVAEKARFPVIERMAGQKLAFCIDKVFVVHLAASS
jgi:hypothetical protein